MFLKSMGLTAVLLSAAATAGQSAAIDKLTEEFVFENLALSPSSATQVGYHRHHGEELDDLLDDFSPKGIQAQLKLIERFEAELSALEASSLDAEARADVEVMKTANDANKLELTEIKSYTHNPTVYVELLGSALYNLYVLHSAPEPARFKHIIERLKHTPQLVRQAEANLIDAPEVWNRVAREENQGTMELIDTTLKGACPQALRGDFDAAAADALAALKSFSGWLESTLSKKQGDWRLGKDLYAKKFKLTLVTGKTPEELLREAESDLTSVRAEMVKLAAPKTVEQALAEVASHHATSATYMDQARKDLAEATAFVKEKDLLSLPGHANLKVVETPVFMRGGYGVGGFNSAPTLEPQLGAFYWVTPIGKDWPQARIDSKLREYNDSGLLHLTVHEAMPGHYVQAEFANAMEPRSRRLLRAIYGNGPYVEGWAVYVQQVMAEQGFKSDTLGYKLTLEKQMLRVLGNTILDVKLQTMAMSDQAALDFMTHMTYQETEEATEKLQRAKLSSCQLPTYYAGYKGWIEVRKNAQTRLNAAFKLKAFHEAALREGAVPLPVLDQLINK